MFKNVQGAKFSNNIFNSIRSMTPTAKLPQTPGLPDASGVLEQIRHGAVKQPPAVRRP